MDKPSSTISFHFLTKNISLKSRTILKAFIIQMFKIEKVPLENLAYIFCTDEYLHNINVAYLDHDTYTDIITFLLSNNNRPVVSDIYISTDRIKENAFTFQTTLQKELHRVIFHGALHLCGYSDKSEKQKFQMRAKEDFYLDKYFVSRGTF